MQKLLQDVHIGDNIQRLRKNRNFSQTDMVTKLQLLGRSMSRANYAHIEQGIRNIYISDLILLKKILNVDYEDFFKGLTPRRS
ncbi:MAG: XRE family transcriptional regulator [Gracilibacter sp. BRH_c7a]|nr:MAG: XRE family transcriptional regulator [Gracilibacter sp. BRH_c7a]